MNLGKLRLCSKRVLAITITVAVCLSLAGCSFIDDFFGIDNSQPTEESKSLLSEIPAPKHTSYSYSAITDEHIRNLYAQIENECQKLSPEEIQCTALLSQKEIYEAIIAFKNDRPDVFWLSNRFSYYDFDGSTYVEIAFITTEAELSRQKQKFSDAVDSFVSTAEMYSSEYEREKYVNDYIVSICEYDEEAAQADNPSGMTGSAYGVLVEGKALCEGYARAFQLLCNKMGIECVSVAGMTDSVGHEWNCVLINGNWYQVDVTWNDSGSEVDRYYYFNLTDEQMYSTHKPDKLFCDIEADNYKNDDLLVGNLFVPECNSEEYNYYQQTAPTLCGFDEESDEIISSALADSAVNGDKYFSIIISPSLDYDEAYEKLVNEAYVVDYIEKANNSLWGKTELSTTSYAYQNETLRIVTIELSYVD